MPRCFSISIQSEVAWREALRAFTEPAIWIAPENRSSFSVSVVLPASGWEMIAKVRRRRVWEAKDMGGERGARSRARAAGQRARFYSAHSFAPASKKAAAQGCAAALEDSSDSVDQVDVNLTLAQVVA